MDPGGWVKQARRMEKQMKKALPAESELEGLLSRPQADASEVVLFVLGKGKLSRLVLISTSATKENITDDCGYELYLRRTEIQQQVLIWTAIRLSTSMCHVKK
jgi:hypothetical protein